ncbi:MAG: peptidyl-prolyl cis-trans isomerase [Phycisphaerae bacterium]|nr:peptidyl-prolyl cis-trans isomerase [Phycisphaerae bacterium]
MYRPLVVALCATLCIGCEPNGQGQEVSASKQKAQPVTKSEKKQPEKQQQDNPPASKNPVVVLETSQGDIVIELNPDKAPATVENFLQYVDDKQYDGLIFHRVIPGFMIQGGGFTPEMTQKPTRDPVANEADNGLRNDRGTIAMARTSDPNSASAQFFINHKNNDFLNHQSKTPQGWGYCVFGKVVDGMDVVDGIAKVQTGTRGMYENVPVEAVVIQRAYRKE